MALDACTVAGAQRGDELEARIKDLEERGKILNEGKS